MDDLRHCHQCSPDIEWRDVGGLILCFGSLKQTAHAEEEEEEGELEDEDHF